MADRQLRPTYGSNAPSVYLLDDHELVRRGLRQLLESNGFSIAGETGSAREAAREIPSLRPDLAILDDGLPDGSGAGVCRAVAAADVSIPCVLLTGESGEPVLIEAILAGAWGCLSKQDDSSELLRLLRRVLGGHTAYSRLFALPRAASSPSPAPSRPEDRLMVLSRQELRTAVGLASGLSNRQISLEMSLAEKTVKNLVSSVLMKLGMERRTQAAVLVTTALGQSDDGLDGGYRFSQFPDLVTEVTEALLACTREVRPAVSTEGTRAEECVRLADALAAARAGMTSFRAWPNRTTPNRTTPNRTTPTRTV
ncbi:MAG TPA: response regulator transcription factor [Arthrobacter sp.]|nr:response regulator transcription factor [Arthrobacter sp.]